MTKGRTPRTPRTLRNPIEHAMLGATCLTPAERHDTLAPTRDCLDRLRRGVATEDQHTVLHTVLKIAEGIEDKFRCATSLPIWRHCSQFYHPDANCC